MHLDGNLFRRNSTGAWLKCIDGTDVDNVMRETHEELEAIIQLTGP